MLNKNWLRSISLSARKSGDHKQRLVRSKKRRSSHVPAHVESAEPRVVLAAPTSQFGNQTNQFLSGGFLSAPSTDTPETIATQFLTGQADTLGLQAGDVSSFRVTSTTTSKGSGLTHVYLRQQINGIDVDGGDANVSVTKDGRVLSAGSRLYPNLTARAVSAKSISASQAVSSAASFVGISSPQLGNVTQNLGGSAEAVTFAGGNVSTRTVPTKLVYKIGSDGKLHLAWNLNLQVPGSDDWFDMNVDAATGEVLSQTNWTHYSSIPNAKPASSSSGTSSSDGASSLMTKGPGGPTIPIANGVPGSGTFNVFPLPMTAPNDGTRSLQTDPADTAASPFGWNDTNGASGAEFTDTRGNNVSAQEDADNNNTGGARPNGTASLNFDFPLDLTMAPSTYTAAATTQLFYMNNIIHDIHYHYGFDEASGNFQVNNYGNGGLGNDAVQADSQDGSGVNNANFATPPDGFAPRMQQYIFTSPNPDRDSSLDNEIIIHEYGHGVSTRLTGGPANSNSLDALQSGGMGEGWGDFWALMFTQRPTDTENQGFGVGTYVLNQPTTGAGIRRFRYSYDMGINPLTYGDYNLSNEVHDSGEIWASVLWDLNWVMIDKHGYNADLYAGYTGPGDAGNLLTLQLVMDALKLQPSNPSFLDGRDAILAADLALTGGDNQAEIWATFARRGMGLSAYDGGGPNATTVTEAFDVPANGIMSGIVFNDVDGNGAQDPGDLGRGNWRVYVDENNNGVFDSATTQTTYTAVNVPQTIVDNGITTSTLNVSGSEIIKDINVRLRITHTFDADLNITLISPSGTRVRLATYNGGNGANFNNTTFDDEGTTNISRGTAPFNGTFKPVQALSKFDLENPNGTWTLEVSDDFASDLGVLQSWSMTITTGNELSQLSTPGTGAYSFTKLPAGNYVVRDVLQSGYIRTAPASVFYTVPLATDEVVSNLHFGNRLFSQNPVVTVAGGPYVYTENDPPMLMETSATVTDPDSTDFDGGSLTVTLGGGVEATDRLVIRNQGTAAGEIGVSGSDVTYEGIVIGTFTGGAGTTPLVISFNASSTPAAAEALIRNLQFFSVSENPSIVNRTLSYVLNDGLGGIHTLTTATTIQVINVNDAPVLAGIEVPAVSYTENGAAILLTSAITIADLDHTTMTGGTVKIIGNYASAEDVLSFVNTATITGVWSSITGTLTLSGTDTLANYRTALSSVRYRNTSDAPSTLTRTVEFQVTDGTNTSNTQTRDINITAVNDRPVLSNIEGTELVFIENSLPMPITQTLLVQDLDHAVLQGARIEITQNYQNGEDFLSFTNTGTITGTWNQATGTLTLTGADTLANYQAALRSVTYYNPSEFPGPLVRQVTLTVTDGVQESLPVVRQVRDFENNDLPVLANIGATPLTFVEQAAAIPITSTITVADLDNTQMASAYIEITGNYQPGGDILGFVNTPTITGQWFPETRQLILTGVDSLANYQAALRTVTYRNISDNPGSLARTISIKVNDGRGYSNTLTRNINIVPVNDGAVLSAVEATPLPYVENTSASVSSSVIITDIDNTHLSSARFRITGNYRSAEDRLTFVNTPTITGTWDTTHGVLTLTGVDTVANYRTAIRSVKYLNLSDNPVLAPRTVSFLVNDGVINSNVVSRQIAIARVNDGPRLTGIETTPLSFTENGAAINLTTSVAASDPDSTHLASARIRIAENYQSGADLLAFTNTATISATWDAATGTLILTGNDTVAAYQTALRSVTYRNTSDNPTTLARKVLLLVNDGTTNSNVVSRNINVTAVNDDPALATLEASPLVLVAGGPGATVTSSLTVTDPDSTHLTGAQIRIGLNYQSGADFLSFSNTVNIIGSFNATTGVLTLTGSDTVANYQAALRSIRYRCVVPNPASLSKEIHFTVSQGVASSNLAIRTVNLTAPV